MPSLRANGLQFEYDAFGDRSAPALLLIGGLGNQLIFWPEEFCAALARCDFHVIRFDNRDIGLSTKLDHLGAPDLVAMDAGESPPYSLTDMAADTAGLLDAMKVPSAHVVGISMGGCIAQLLAINHREKVLTLTSMMSWLSGRDAVGETAEVHLALQARQSSESEDPLEEHLAFVRMISGPYFDELRVRRQLTRAAERGAAPLGAARQAAALRAAPSRLAALRKLNVPALVIHGEVDPLIPVENGRRTADALRAELLVLPQVGHELPPQIWPPVTEAIAGHARKIDGRLS